MEKNCFVTKLRAEVNNSELFEVVGGFEFDTKASVYGEITMVRGLDSSHQIKVKLPVGVTPTGGYTSYDAETNEVTCYDTLIVSVNSTLIHCVLKDKYNLSRIYLSNDNRLKNTSAIKACRYIEYIGVGGTDLVDTNFDLSDFYPNSVKTFSFTITNPNVSAKGNLNSWITGCDSTKLVTLVVKNNKLIDEDTNITTLCGRFTALTELSFHGVTKMVGTVESLVAEQVSRGRTTCNQITISNGGTLGTKVTFNGAAITGIVGVVSTLKWRPTTSSAEGAVTDICLNSTAITIAANGTKIADTTPW